MGPGTVRRLEAGERLRDVAAIDLSTTTIRRWWRRYHGTASSLTVFQEDASQQPACDWTSSDGCNRLESLPRPAALGPLTEPWYPALRIPMTPDSTLSKVLCLVVLAVLAIAAGYAFVISVTNYNAIGV